jgi:hypothetical protein
MPAIPELRVTSWKELNEQVYEGSWNADLRRHRSTFAFRGMTDASADLRTTLLRLGGPTSRLEGHLLRNFRKYAERERVPGGSVWNWLAVAQHHGLPTRLLDWTYSPYVAMHFVTHHVDAFDVDGVIWCIDYDRTNRLLPEVLKHQLHEEGSYVFTAEMLARAAGSLQEFDALNAEPFLLFFEPPSLDNRIVNQFALFTLLSSPQARLDRWLERQPDAAKRLVIPAELKWEIRDKLDQANINERVLFPGLEGLSRWLKRYYMPR